MNCDDLRERLPLLIYGDLSPEETRLANSHLADCAACQREREALIATHHSLDSATVPDVAIDLPSIHGRALAMQARSMRRWKRFAIAAGSLAACLLAFLLIRPDVRVGDGQLVIRWNSKTEQQPQAEQAPIVVQQPQPRDADLDERIRVLSELVQVLTLQMESNDQQRREELEVLITRLDLLRIQSQQRWDETKRDVSALYTAQFGRRE